MVPEKNDPLYMYTLDDICIQSATGKCVRIGDYKGSDDREAIIDGPGVGCESEVLIIVDSISPANRLLLTAGMKVSIKHKYTNKFLSYDPQTRVLSFKEKFLGNNEIFTVSRLPSHKTDMEIIEEPKDYYIHSYDTVVLYTCDLSFLSVMKSPSGETLFEPISSSNYSNYDSLINIKNPREWNIFLSKYQSLHYPNALNDIQLKIPEDSMDFSRYPDSLQESILLDDIETSIHGISGLLYLFDNHGEPVNMSSKEAYISSIRYILFLNDQHIESSGCKTISELYFSLQQYMSYIQCLDILCKDIIGLKGAKIIDYLIQKEEDEPNKGNKMIYSRILSRCVHIYTCHLKRWLYAGILQDMYNEFLVLQDVSGDDLNPLDKTSIIQDNIPSYLRGLETKIEFTGIYLLIAKNSDLFTEKYDSRCEEEDDFTDPERYKELVEKAYLHANEIILNHLKSKYHLSRLFMTCSNVFLLSRGDFITYIEEQLHDEFNKPSDSIDIYSLNNIVSIIFQQCLPDCSWFIPYLYVDLEIIKDTGLLNPPKDGWNCFNLRLKLPEFMEQFIPNSETYNYTQIFKFLFLIHRLYTETSSVFLDIQEIKALGANVYIRELSLIHGNMLSFVTTLYTYLTMQVIEPSNNRFYTELNQVKSLPELRDSIHNYLDKLMEDLMIHNRYIFCRLVSLIEYTFICLDYIRQIIDNIINGYSEDPVELKRLKPVYKTSEGRLDFQKGNLFRLCKSKFTHDNMKKLEDNFNIMVATFIHSIPKVYNNNDEPYIYLYETYKETYPYSLSNSGNNYFKERYADYN
ncbi:hypothetical protein WA158_006662 [Blastocystis sp. Blastoise]